MLITMLAIGLLIGCFYFILTITAAKLLFILALVFVSIITSRFIDRYHKKKYKYNPNLAASIVKVENLRRDTMALAANPRLDPVTGLDYVDLIEVESNRSWNCKNPWG